MFLEKPSYTSQTHEQEALHQSTGKGADKEESELILSLHICKHTWIPIDTVYTHLHHHDHFHNHEQRERNLPSQCRGQNK